MNLTSMKTTPAEAKEEAKEMIGDASTQPQYPYGLSISIDDEMMTKLGIKDLPAVGTEMMLMAKCEVCSTSAYDTQTNGPEINFSLQITDMALESPNGPSIAERLYGKKG